MPEKKWMVFTFFGLLALYACSDPIEEARKVKLRASIHTTKVRIDSLQAEKSKMQKLLDSLDLH
ncbi:MAG TPA: hypothetical protein VLM37_11090 [Fibrobacteraceae bacterium]|nr:hypothetical protein [Fibrobacteraceae bacterium]